MLDFHASIWRCLTAIRHERPFRPSLIRKRRFTPSQSFATASGHSRLKRTAKPDVDSLQTDLSWEEARDPSQVRTKPDRAGTVTIESGNGSGKLWRELRGKADDNSDAPTGVAAGVHGHILRELVWLKDPLKLAERTRQLLALGEIPKAFELVRLASRDAQCPICWNALLDHMMMYGRVKAAFQTYNDVQSPLHAIFPYRWLTAGNLR
jgi:hypothetical protein